MIIALIFVSVLVVSTILYFSVIGSLKKEEPVIIALSEPIKMIGVSIRTNQKRIFNDALKLGNEYKKVKESGIIQNKKNPWQFVAISKEYDENGSWEYLIGDVVTSINSVPDGLKSFEIPPITYAVFTIKPKSRFAWGIAMGRMKKYIYTKWILNSAFELDYKTISDFELHDYRSERKNPEIDLYVAVKLKNK